MIVSEMFAGLQGEGPSIGIPSVFLRLGGCNLRCVWCDTLPIWTKGELLTTNQVVDALLNFEQIPRDMLANREAHIVVTGGEPLLIHNRRELKEVFEELTQILNVVPYIKVETNGTQPLGKHTDFLQYISQINCSPKLANSQESIEKRRVPEVIREIAEFPKSAFKFVVSSEKDWEEIEKDYLPHIEDKKKIYLMPAGIDRDELVKNSQLVCNLAMQHSVRVTTRLPCNAAFGQGYYKAPNYYLE